MVVLSIQAPEGETQPSTEVDLFISTEKIMVLNTDLKVRVVNSSLCQAVTCCYCGTYHSSLCVQKLQFEPCWAISVQFMLLHHIYFGPILMLFSHLCLGLSYENTKDNVNIFYAHIVQ
jgi:hypothetical protein